MRSRLARGSIAFAVIATVVSLPGARVGHASTPYIDPTFNVDVQHDVVYGTAINVVGDPVTLTLDVYTPRGDTCLLYTSPSPRDGLLSRMPSSA